jgi:hypothetical protein
MPYLLPEISVHVVRELLVEHGVPSDEPLLHAFKCTRLRPGSGARARNDGTLFVTERHLCFVQRRTLLTLHRARVFDLREVGLLKLGLGSDAALSIATSRKPKAYQFGRFASDGCRDAAFDAVRTQAKSLGARWTSFGPLAQRGSGRAGDVTPTDTLSNSSSGGLAPARPAGAHGGAADGRAGALAPLDEKLATDDERRVGAARCKRIVRACIRHPHHVVERTVSLFFEKVGGAVADAPRASIAFGLIVALLCSTGLLAAKFETSSHKLYIPQRSELATQRALLGAEFGESPEVSLLVVSRKDGGDLANADSMLALHALHSRIGGVEVADGAGGVASYARVCARRYVAMLGDNVCIVSSPLELWAYSKAALSKDADVRATISEAVAGGKFDLGGVQLLEPAATALVVAPDAPPPPPRYSALATQHILYYNTTLPAFQNGSQLAFERGLRALLEEQNGLDASVQPLKTSYWSSPFNEEEAQSFVSKDSCLMALSILFILLYVCLTLGGATCDPRRSRIGLGLSCALCTALAMSSGFGLASMLGVPLQPISPIVCFTLLGVSVDDMIIIVFSFDQTDPARPLRERLAASMAVSGTMVTVTSFTSFAAFLTGSWVDFPAYAYFCTPAALCILVVYWLQMTVFAGLLALDAERVARLEAKLAAADGLPTLAPGALVRSPTMSEPRVRPLEVLMRAHHARTLLRPSVRALVIVLWFAGVIVAAASLRGLRVGLDVRATLPDHSPILDFVDDVDKYWAGSTNPAHLLVVRGLNASSADELARVRAALGALRALPFVHSVRSDWLAAFETYRRCKGEGERPATKASMRAFLSDGGVHDCAPEAAEGRRRQLARAPSHAPVAAAAPATSVDVSALASPPADLVPSADALAGAGGAAPAAGAIDEPDELSAHDELTASVDAAAAEPSHSLLELLQRAIADSMSSAAMSVSKGSGPTALMQGGMDFEQDVVLGPDDTELIDVRAPCSPTPRAPGPATRHATSVLAQPMALPALAHAARPPLRRPTAPPLPPAPTGVPHHLQRRDAERHAAGLGQLRADAHDARGLRRHRRARVPVQVRVRARRHGDAALRAGQLDAGGGGDLRLPLPLPAADHRVALHAHGRLHRHPPPRAHGNRRPPRRSAARAQAARLSPASCLSSACGLCACTPSCRADHRASSLRRPRARPRPRSSSICRSTPSRSSRSCSRSRSPSTTRATSATRTRRRPAARGATR